MGTDARFGVVHLRALSAVDDEGRLTTAAERLGTTQSAVSRTVAEAAAAGPGRGAVGDVMVAGDAAGL